MRRKIELYIAGKKADLDNQGLLLYNYAFTDLELPSVVKNSFSKQVTLPATANNLQLFGHPEMSQRVTASGASGIGIDFNAGQKTPFELRDECNQILESGYIRLDSTSMKGRKVTGIKVTLFGGIGSFFYSLGYNDDGSKKTLGDLIHAVSLTNFTINATNVQAAWDRIENHLQSQGIEQVWDIINFAPAYNGIPSGDFSADKGIISPAAVGLADSVTDGDKTYRSSANYALLNMKNAHDEWACKDLRSYLQRPVYSMTAFMQAICNPANNGGFQVDISYLPSDLYVNVWKTLPMLSALGSYETMSGTKSFVRAELDGDLSHLARVRYSSAIPLGSQVEADVSAWVGFKLYDTAPASFTPTFKTQESIGSGAYILYRRLIIFTQLVAKGGDVVLAASPAQCFSGDWSDRTTESLATLCGYEPLKEAGFGENQDTNVVLGNNRDIHFTAGLHFEDLQSETASDYWVVCKCYIALTRANTGGGEETFLGATEYPLIILDQGSGNSPTMYGPESIYPDMVSGSAHFTSSQKLRSGAVVSIPTLLSSAHSPADYLLSFCKMHGLVFLYDSAAKKVTILPRNTWFNGETMDLSGRIDRSKEITIQPLAMKSKWYELSGEIVNGAIADEYQKKYGVKYGIQRINTGYDFDAATEELMKAVVFKSAVTRLDTSPYWNILTNADDDLIPSVFLDAGNTYTLWDGEGEGKDFNVPIPDTSVNIAYYNPDNKGYDKPFAVKVEFKDASGKALDGEDVLCRLSTFGIYRNFALTDDSIEMLALNNGKPCWDMSVQSGAAVSLTIPLFYRYNPLTALSPEVSRSLDYGIPREVEMPGITINTTTGSLYLRYWKKYLEDLLDKDTKVMKCRVDLNGLQVGPSLLRKFYWYEGSIWVLNKITNYSLTTWDSVECEFVQVKDKTNYTNGQTL